MQRERRHSLDPSDLTHRSVLMDHVHTESILQQAHKRRSLFILHFEQGMCSVVLFHLDCFLADIYIVFITLLVRCAMIDLYKYRFAHGIYKVLSVQRIVDKPVCLTQFAHRASPMANIVLKSRTPMCCKNIIKNKNLTKKTS